MSGASDPVRPARPADLAAIVEIINEAIAVGHSHFATRPWEVAEARASFEAAGPRHPWWVYEAADGVVGFCKAGPWKARGAYDRTVEVSVFVASSAHGRGVASALYRRFVPALAAAGVHCALAGIALPNEASVRLHERFGFTAAGVLPEVGYKHGAWRDVGYWALVLDD